MKYYSTDKKRTLYDAIYLLKFMLHGRSESISHGFKLGLVDVCDAILVADGRLGRQLLRTDVSLFGSQQRWRGAIAVIGMLDSLFCWRKMHIMDEFAAQRSEGAEPGLARAWLRRERAWLHGDRNESAAISLLCFENIRQLHFSFFIFCPPGISKVCPELASSCLAVGSGASAVGATSTPSRSAPGVSAARLVATWDRTAVRTPGSTAMSLNALHSHGSVRIGDSSGLRVFHPALKFPEFCCLARPCGGFGICEHWIQGYSPSINGPTVSNELSDTQSCHVFLDDGFPHNFYVDLELHLLKFVQLDTHTATEMRLYFHNTLHDMNSALCAH